MNYVIASTVEKDDETGEPLYWNNDQGWVGFSAATLFPEKPELCPADSQCEPHQPWSIIYIIQGDLFNAGPFANEQSAMTWANEHRYRGDDDQDEFEFDLDDEHVYLLGPDHRMTELENGDFEDEVEWTKKLAPGDEVYWNDPDEGTCSRMLTIRSIRWEGDDVFVIEDVDGSVVQGFNGELA